MTVDTLVVPRAELSLEEPWSVPAGCTPIRLRRATDGAEPRLQTTLTLYHDQIGLVALFNGSDDGVVATYETHDDPLWKEDVVELFLAPERLTHYFEIEVSPIGTTFDAAIDSPELDRRTMKTDLGWTCEGLFAAVRTTPETLDVVVRVPFAALGAGPRGEWRANFYRIDRGAGSDEYSAWQPTMKEPADFHVPRAFGVLRFA
jgi:hypothetical protein